MRMAAKIKMMLGKTSIFDKVPCALVTIEIMENCGNHAPKAKETPTYCQYVGMLRDSYLRMVISNDSKIKCMYG